MSAASERVALVTGGSAGIGLALCRRLLDGGYTVLSLARRRAPLDSPRLLSIEVDLADARATRETAFALASRHAITTIVHNAGAVREKALADVAPADLDELTNLHLHAALSLVQANLATMQSQHYGRIVLVSTRAVLGLAKRTAYSATKAGMIGMARTWALELAPHGITVNVVAPGPIAETELFHSVIPADSPQMTDIVAKVPVRRLGKPDDVARAVMFFVAPEAGFVTGQTLFVCGGTSVGSISYS
jgi:NAD(P)-dependent dehydrogenase (short-subunit alcohol dehydrogenase family)